MSVSGNVATLKCGPVACGKQCEQRSDGDGDTLPFEPHFHCFWKPPPSASAVKKAMLFLSL